tara:strand:- start:715 stop:987 length:273 start_codon:yes stop_codon:yes gene_type:complete
MSIYKFETTTIDSFEAVVKSREYDQVDLSEVTKMTGTHASLRFIMADDIFLNKSSVNIAIINNNDDPEGKMEEYITELKSATSGNVEKLA